MCVSKIITVSWRVRSVGRAANNDVGRPEHLNTIRCCAMGILAHGLGDVGRHEERLQIQQTQFSTQMRLWAYQSKNYWPRNLNIAVCLEELGRDEEAPALRRARYATSKRINNNNAQSW